jgi:hypothetical protein
MTRRFAKADVYAVDPFEWGYDPNDGQSKIIEGVGKKYNMNRTQVARL